MNHESRRHSASRSTILLGIGAVAILTAFKVLQDCSVSSSTRRSAIAATEKSLKSGLYAISSAVGLEAPHQDESYIYQLKDRRPLSEKTQLEPDSHLWFYPEVNRTLQPWDLKGPWYSQTDQDMMLYTGFFREHPKGFFIELGAVDGVTYSNTKFFQDSMEWGGILIEPSSDFEYLSKGIRGYEKGGNPKGQYVGQRCLLEKGVTCLNAAVCQTDGTLKMVRSDGDAEGLMVGGGAEYLTERHKHEFNIKADGADLMYEVACKPFGKLLRESGVKHVDLLSLDVEGAEEVVLETMDWSIPVHVIVIEAHEKNSPTGPEGHERKHRILLENGFQFLMHYKYDEWWVNPSNSRLNSLTGIKPEHADITGATTISH